MYNLRNLTQLLLELQSFIQAASIKRHESDALKEILNLKAIKNFIH